MLDCIQVPVTLPLSYLHRPASSWAGSQSKLILFLHGYTDSARSFLKRAWPEPEEAYHVLAPNGPFPVPVKTNDGYKAAFSWYFIDDSKKDQPQVVIPPSICIGMLTTLIQTLGYEDHPKIIVGFSQGGFLAPRLALQLKNVERIIGVGTGYQSADYQKLKNIEVDAIHGDQDPIIPLKVAQTGFSLLEQTKKQFFEVGGLAHTLNNEAQAILKASVKRA
jgi:predicted esterase